MSQKVQIKSTGEKALLVGVITQKQNEKKAIEYLDELTFLAKTAGAKTIKRFTQKVDKINSKTFIGSGKIQEIVLFAEKEEIDLIVFDDELTPSQFRNIEIIFGKRKILDRTNLILDIFARRAKTAYACTQVELAQYEYLLPRLTRMWTHLQKQKGGVGMRGPGETEIETDRRIIRERISILKKKLKTIDKQMATQRKNRDKMIRASLVGYTNVGKSTIMNVLSKSKLFAENKLFATLDTTVRKVVIDNMPFLLSDTVGFIRKLPTQLVEAFKSSLDEVREADFLIHVVDISHSNFEEQMNSVNKVLYEINALEKPTLIVFNKIDRYTYIEKEPDDLSPKTKENKSLDDWKKTWMSQINKNCIFISAYKKENLEDFKSLIYDLVKNIYAHKYPFKKFLY